MQFACMYLVIISSYLMIANLLLVSAIYQLGTRIPSAASPAVINARTPPKKPSIGQKKPLEAHGSSPPLPRWYYFVLLYYSLGWLSIVSMWFCSSSTLPFVKLFVYEKFNGYSYSKKQKVSGAYSDQSIEQLNDVTAVSGVNLRVCYSAIFSSALYNLIKLNNSLLK